MVEVDIAGGAQQSRAAKIIGDVEIGEVVIEFLWHQDLAAIDTDGDRAILVFVAEAELALISMHDHHGLDIERVSGPPQAFQPDIDQILIVAVSDARLRLVLPAAASL